MKIFFRYMLSILIPAIFFMFWVKLSTVSKNKDLEEPVPKHQISSEATYTEKIIHYFSTDTRLCAKGSCNYYPLFGILVFGGIFVFFFFATEGDLIQRETFEDRLSLKIESGKVLTSRIILNEIPYLGIIKKHSHLYLLEITQEDTGHTEKQEFYTFLELVNYMDSKSVFRLSDFKNT